MGVETIEQLLDILLEIGILVYMIVVTASCILGFPVEDKHVAIGICLLLAHTGD